MLAPPPWTTSFLSLSKCAEDSTRLHLQAECFLRRGCKHGAKQCQHVQGVLRLINVARQLHWSPRRETKNRKREFFSEGPTLNLIKRCSRDTRSDRQHLRPRYRLPALHKRVAKRQSQSDLWNVLTSNPLMYVHTFTPGRSLKLGTSVGRRCSSLHQKKQQQQQQTQKLSGATLHVPQSAAGTAPLGSLHFWKRP